MSRKSLDGETVEILAETKTVNGKILKAGTRGVVYRHGPLGFIFYPYPRKFKNDYQYVKAVEVRLPAASAGRSLPLQGETE